MGTKGARTSGGTDRMAAAIRTARFMVVWCFGSMPIADERGY